MGYKFLAVKYWSTIINLFLEESLSGLGKFGEKPTLPRNCDKGTKAV